MRALGGRYRLEEPLGTGGMAVVWRGYDLVLGRPVAVKLLTARLADDDSRKRIHAEAKVAARLTHPNVAGVYDFGESRMGRRRVPYIVMELVDGPTLANRLHDGRLHWRTAVRITAEVAAALAAAHACGVVHRDVKPANIMLARTGVKVVDFGIAAAAGALEDREGVLLGTPAYVAPERLDGEPALPAADVYALGVVLYQCLTGALPWSANTLAELIAAHRETAPAPLPPIDGLPADVAALWGQCMAKAPTDRPTSLHTARVLSEAAGVRVAVGGFDESGGRSRGVAPVAVSGPDTRGQLAVRWPGRKVLAVVGLVGAVAAGTAVTAAQFAEPDPGMAPPGAAASPRPGRCMARYVAEHGTTGSFSAEVIVVNTGDDAPRQWRLGFALPGGQRVTAARGARWDQAGEAVTLVGEDPLPAGMERHLVISGTYADRPAAPTSFTLGGVPCEHTMVDVRGATPPRKARPSPRPSGTGRRGPSASSAGTQPDGNAASGTTTPAPGGGAVRGSVSARSGPGARGNGHHPPRQPDAPPFPWFPYPPRWW